jgi:hypothetical protein
VKYLILDNFHFRIDPQIINYNDLSFHTSMGLPELVWADRHFIETNFPVSLSDSESRSAQAKDQRSSGLLQLESHFRKLERRAAEGGALGRSWLLP